MKTLTRKDTGKTIEEKMSNTDWNLWNQYVDEKDEKENGLKVTVQNDKGEEIDVTEKLGF